MKKQLLALVTVALLGTGYVRAQDDEFPQVWEAEFTNKAKVLSVVNSDGSMIVGSDENEVSVLDGQGKQLWYSRFKDLTDKEGVKNGELQNIYFDAGMLFLFEKKMGKDKLTVVDIKAGKALWTTDRYSDLTEDNIEYIPQLGAFFFSLKNTTVLVDAKTGQQRWETDKFKGSVGAFLYDDSRNELLMINYKPSQLAALFSGFKNQLIRINAANGEVKWSTSFFGFVERKVLTREALASLTLKGGKVFLELDGIQVFDHETGQMLWSAVYESDEEARRGLFNRGPHGGRVIKGGIYGAIAEPLYTNDGVYVVLGSGKLRTKFIAKYDLESGKKLWESEKITGAGAMPNLHLEDGRLVAQIGGIVNKQTIENKVETGPNGTVTTIYYNNEWDFMGGYGIIALDPASGAKVWRSEKFDKRITDLVFGDGMVFAGSGDEFYGFDVKSGELKINVDHSKGAVGKSMWAFDNGESVALVCDKGLAAYNKKDGAKLYTTDKFRGVSAYHRVGGNFFLRRDNGSSNTICAVDLKTGVIKGEVKSKGKGGGGQYGDGIDITTDGEYIFTFKGKDVQKLKVNR